MANLAATLPKAAQLKVVHYLDLPGLLIFSRVSRELNLLCWSHPSWTLQKSLALPLLVEDFDGSDMPVYPISEESWTKLGSLGLSSLVIDTRKPFFLDGLIRACESSLTTLELVQPTNYAFPIFSHVSDGLLRGLKRLSIAQPSTILGLDYLIYNLDSLVDLSVDSSLISEDIEDEFDLPDTTSEEQRNLPTFTNLNNLRRLRLGKIKFAQTYPNDLYAISRYVAHLELVSCECDWISLADAFRTNVAKVKTLIIHTKRSYYLQIVAPDELDDDLNMEAEQEVSPKLPAPKMCLDDFSAKELLDGMSHSRSLISLDMSFNALQVWEHLADFIRINRSVKHLAVDDHLSRRQKADLVNAGDLAEAIALGSTLEVVSLRVWTCQEWDDYPDDERDLVQLAKAMLKNPKITAVGLPELHKTNLKRLLEDNEVKKNRLLRGVSVLVGRRVVHDIRPDLTILDSSPVSIAIEQLVQVDLAKPISQTGTWWFCPSCLNGS
jgi:hypothetical protein